MKTNNIDIKNNKNTVEGRLFSGFRHEMNNFHQALRTHLDTLSTSKRQPVKDRDYSSLAIEKIFDYVKKIKKSAEIRNTLYQWYKNPEQEVSVRQVFELLEEICGKKIEFSDLSEEEINSFKNMQVVDSYSLYELLSQVIFNAKKYGYGELEATIIKKDSEYFLRVFNHTKEPVPDGEIKEILKGEGYRASQTRDEKLGDGFGYKEIKRILVEKGLDKYIDDLIKTGLEEGFCVEMPIIGIVKT